MSTLSQSPPVIAAANAESNDKRWLALPLVAFPIYWLLLRGIFFSASHSGGALTILPAAAAITLPLAGLAIVVRSPLAGYLMVVIPPFTVALAVLIGITSAGGFWPVLAIAIPIVVFGGGIALSGSDPRFVRLLHRATVVALLAFVLAHLSNHLFALNSLAAHKTIQNALRLVYRNNVIEPLLIVAVFTQAVSGIALVWRARRSRRRFIDHAQAASGLVMAAFLCAHVTAVIVTGRTLAHVDTDFAFASQGAAGLLHSMGGVRLIPYYFLAPLAFFAHAALAMRHSVRPRFSQMAANRLAILVTGAGFMISAITLVALCGFRPLR